VSDDLTDLIQDTIAEAVALRQSVEVPPISATITELHEHLLHTRSVLDRIEMLTVKLRRGLGRARLAQRETEAELAAAENVVYERATGKFDQYSTGRERAALVASKTPDEIAAARNAAERVIQVETAFDICSLMRWSVDGLRREVDTRMKMVTFERSMER
jgi:hypothetical protein